MHFSHRNKETGGKAGRFAVVAGLHVLVAIGVIHTMNAKTIKLPALIDDPLVWVKPEVPPPSPPPEPPMPRLRSAPPPIAVPEPEVPVLEPPPQPLVSASTEAQPQPAQAAPSTPTEVAPAAPASTNGGQMRSAVLADARGCVKPDYPARAARNGESGTVTLALLVGADGRVKDARIQSSSGSRDLDRAALNALSLCQFKPAMNKGVAEAGWGQIAYVWTLE